MKTTTIGLMTIHDQFMTDLREKKRTSSTILAYSSDIRQLIDFLTKTGKASFSQVTTSDLEDFLKSLNHDYVPKTISRKTNAIKTFYLFMLNKRIVSFDSSSPINHPQFKTQQPRILSKLEYRALRDACREDLRTSAIVEILLQTGIRISELANLTLDDLKENNLFIKPYESHNGRNIILNKAAKTSLDHYLSLRPNNDEKTIFITKTGKPLLVRNIRNTIDRYFKETGIKDACVNDLRHTFIYHQLIAGAPIALVSKLVGHKRLSSTKKYLELVRDKIKERTKLEEL